MRHLMTILVLTAMCCPVGVTQPNASTSTAENEIRNLGQKWLDAAAGPDLPALRLLLANDFMGTAFGTRVLTKDDVVPTDGTGDNHMPKSQLKNTTVRVFGDTAVLMGDIQPENSREGGLRVTTVFQKRTQGWQIVAIHMSAAQQ